MSNIEVHSYDIHVNDKAINRDGDIVGIATADGNYVPMAFVLTELANLVQ